MTQPGLAPRRAAHYLIDQVTQEGRLLSELIGAGALEHLPPEDRARAQRLAVTVLRWMDRADRMLKPFLKKTPHPSVQNALRLGTVEIWNGEAAHGVVNSCVEIVGKNKRTESMKGLVNAVLRKVGNERPGAWDRLPEPRLPNWLRRPLIDAWGTEAIAGIERAHAAGAPLDITAKGDVAALADKLGGTVLPTGSIRLHDAGQVTQLPGYDSGEWWVQDAAAALPVRIAAPQKGERALDLCAAPGGKTLQLAAMGAKVTALDVSDKRIARVNDNLERTGLKAEVVVGDAFDFVQGGFDIVLLDAPCSATGTIRRHPDLPYAKDGSEFGELIGQQEAMIDHALSLVAPGGRLVFCTCSLLPDEGEVQVEEALLRHKNLTVDRDALMVPGVEDSWIMEEGGLRLRPDYWPELGGMDGFYVAVLRKAA